MIWLVTIACCLLGFIIYLLIAPIYIEVNTKTDLYRLRLHRLFSITFVPGEKNWYMNIQLAWWVKKTGFDEGPKSVKKQRPERKKRKQPFAWRKILAAIGTFKVTQCHIHLDTGDASTNGICFPVVYLLGYYTGKDIHINFEGRNEVELEIKSSIGRMTWAYITKR